MGEKYPFQPLTRQDKITVFFYRTGIFISTLIISITALLAIKSTVSTDIQNYQTIISGYSMNILLLMIFFSVGLSVFFIHLYVGSYYRMLKKIYYVAVLCLVFLSIIGKGNPAITLFRVPTSTILMIPLSLCLGFVTAKEAFCFRLYEGYMLAIIMPAYIFLYSIGALNPKSATFGLALIAVMLVFFMFRKVFQPMHYDIGDKSAYQP